MAGLHVSIDPTMDQRKTLLYFRLCGMDIEAIKVFRNNQLEGTDQRSCSF